MEEAPSQTRQALTHSYGESDDEDDIPLARLKDNKMSSEDEPLANLRATSSPMPELSSEDERLDDSDADPDFKPGLCEVKHCREEVWAACENCDILVCYDHCIEDVRSCEDHGKVDKKKEKHRTAQRKSEKKQKDLEVQRKNEPSDGGELSDIRGTAAEVERQVRGEGAESEERQEREGPEERERQERREPEEGESQERGEGESQERGEGESQERGGEEEGESQERGEGEEGGERQKGGEGQEGDRPVRGRKRMRNPEDWKRNIQKCLRNSGQPYISATGKEKAARKIGPCCNSSCALKCSAKFNESDRESIFNAFWAYADKREQKHFILRHIERCPVKRKRVGSEKRNVTFRYFLYAQKSRVQVCRTFFLNTLDVRRDFIYNTLEQVSGTGGLKTSRQGKHGNQKKIEESTIQGVKDHIASFPHVDSHYCRADSEKKYLDPSLSVTKMYRLYTAMCDKNGSAKATENKYRKIFDYDFNLAFHRPKKDQCETCIAHKHNQKPTEENELLFKNHLENKITARRIKDQAKADSQSPTKTSCAFDLQQILLCPHGHSSSFYYKRRLGVYNLTVYDYKHGDAFCFMWPEHEGSRGSNEVATCLYNYIEDRSREGVNELHMFSDNCAGQNRNRFVAFALHFARTNLNLKSIIHSFLEKGHTETENDSVHATIERRTRYTELYTPEQWYAAVRTARCSKQPYVVKEMTSGDFIDFKAMASSVRNLSVDDEGEKVMWSKVREVSAVAGDPNALHIKTSYSGPSQRLDLNRRKRKSGDGVDASEVRIQKGMVRPGIVEAKKRDLISLCNAGQIPSSYRQFYDSLPIGDSLVEQEDP